MFGILLHTRLKQFSTVGPQLPIIIESINYLVNKMSENSEKCLSDFAKARGDVIRLPFLFCLTNSPK